MSEIINPQEILFFWFGNKPEMTKEKAKFWFIANSDNDKIIKEKFEATLFLAKQGKLDSWTQSAKSRLALIILLDQFPRNIYRKTAKAFAFDELAVGICHQGIKQNQDQELSLIEKMFFYMPLQHSEILADQELSIQLFGKLAKADTKLQASFESAEKHHKIIAQFSRFPHRNYVLGRHPTHEEEDFAKDMPSFGQ